MHFARDQPRSNGLSESRSAVDEDEKNVIAIGNEQRSGIPQSQLQPQPSSPPPSLTYARDREIDPMRHSSAWRVRDDNRDDDENEEEQQSDDNV